MVVFGVVVRIKASLLKVGGSNMNIDVFLNRSIIKKFILSKFLGFVVGLE
jgi:hypothetical protein